MQFHDLRAGAVGIDEVELPLRIAADLGKVVLAFESMAAPQQRIRRFDVAPAVVPYAVCVILSEF